MTTLEEHNERLVLEKQALKQRLAALEGQAGRIIVALLGENKTRKITPGKWAESLDHDVWWEPDDDGGIVIHLSKRDTDTDDD